MGIVSNYRPVLAPLLAAAVVGFLLTVSGALAEEPARPLQFERDVRPIFERQCLECHGDGKARGGLRLGTAGLVREGGVSGRAVIPGDAKRSYLMQCLRGEGGEDGMPPEGDPLTVEQMAVIERWIAEG